MAGIGMLGDSAAGGLEDPQAMRIMMLQTRLGRRINEILMLDADPLLPLAPGPQSAAGPGALTARLRYQQTKIDGAPDTIPVDAEITAVIRAQQEWASAWLEAHAAPGTRPRYLFLGLLFNRNADRPYVSATLHKTLTELARRLGIRDSSGRMVDFQRTHRFRHTRATSLLNAGVPVHVVQRYLGHLSPAMTMHTRRPWPKPMKPSSSATGRSPPTPATCRRAPRPLRHAAAGQAHRPHPAQRLVPAAPAPVLRPRKLLPDLRKFHHRRDVPGAASPERPHPRPHRHPPGRVHRQDRHPHGPRQRLAQQPAPRGRALDAIITALESAPEAPGDGSPQAVRGAGTAARADAAIARQEERSAR